MAHDAKLKEEFSFPDEKNKFLFENTLQTDCLRFAFYS